MCRSRLFHWPVHRFRRRRGHGTRRFGRAFSRRKRRFFRRSRRLFCRRNGNRLLRIGDVRGLRRSRLFHWAVRRFRRRRGRGTRRLGRAFSRRKRQFFRRSRPQFCRRNGNGSRLWNGRRQRGVFRIFSPRVAAPFARRLVPAGQFLEVSPAADAADGQVLALFEGARFAREGRVLREQERLAVGQIRGKKVGKSGLGAGVHDLGDARLLQQLKARAHGRVGGEAGKRPLGYQQHAAVQVEKRQHLRPEIVDLRVRERLRRHEDGPHTRPLAHVIKPRAGAGRLRGGRQKNGVDAGRLVVRDGRLGVFRRDAAQPSAAQHLTDAQAARRGERLHVVTVLTHAAFASFARLFGIYPLFCFRAGRKKRSGTGRSTPRRAP